MLTLPAGIACLAVNAALIAWMFRTPLPAGLLVDRSPPKPAMDNVLAVRGGLAALLTFAVMAMLGVELAGAAMTAAAALVVIARVPPKQAFEQVDWSLLAFLAGLVVVAFNLVSNVPLVLIAVSWVPHVPAPSSGWIMLAVASTLADNLMLFGSVANLFVMEGAGPRAEIGFWKFLRYGAVLTLASLMVAFTILGIERAIGIPGWLGL